MQHCAAYTFVHRMYGRQNSLVGRDQAFGIAYFIFKILKRKAQDTDLFWEGTTPRLANRFMLSFQSKTLFQRNHCFFSCPYLAILKIHTVILYS